MALVYYNIGGNDDAWMGREIYHKALSGRRGFRPDQIGIPETDDVWLEIFEAIGAAAREGQADRLRDMANQRETTDPLAAMALDGCADEIERLRALMISHGIDPDSVTVADALGDGEDWTR